jgi:hypothetical protein
MTKATKHSDSESRTDDPKVEGGEKHRVISLVESNLAPPVDAAVAARVARDTAPFPIVKSDEDPDEGE